MRMAIFGPPGAGKGTQSDNLVAEYSVPHISTGNILRQAIEEGTPLGLEAASFIRSGDLVPDSVMIGVIENRLHNDDCRQGFLLDGFPRTVPQAEALDTMLEGLKMPLDFVLNLEVPEDLLLQRLVSRGQGREDDKPEVIAERLRIYQEKTAPLIDFYDAKELLVNVDGVGKVEEVFTRIQSVIERIKDAVPA